MPKKGVNVKNAKRNVLARRKAKAPVNLSNTSQSRKVAGPNKDAKWMQRITGTETLGALFELDQVQSFDFCQLDLHGTRTGNLFKIYEKHFVHKLKYRFKPILGATAKGQLSMAFEHDVTDLPPTPDTAIAHFASFADNVLGPIAQEHSLVVQNRRLPDGAFQHMTLFNDPSDGARESCFGSLRTYVIGTGLASTEAVGTLYVEYDITFVSPEIETNDNEITTPSGLDRIYCAGAGTGGSDVAPSLTAMVNDGIGTTSQLTCYNAAHTALYDMDPGDVYCGIIDSVAGALSLRLPTGGEVPLGTRVYWRPATQEFDLTAGTGEISTTQPIIGWIATALGVAGMLLSYAGGLDSYMAMRDVRRLRFH